LFSLGGFLQKQDKVFLDSWLDYKLASEACAKSTCDKYRNYVERLSEFLKSKSLLLAAKEELIEFTGLHLHEAGASPSSRRAAVAAVKGFYSWLHENDHVQTNESEKIVYPKKLSKVPIVMGLKNSEKLLMQPDISTFKGLRDAAIISVLIGTGARINGVTNLNQNDLIPFDYDGVERLAVRLREKGGKERMIPLPAESAILVRAYLGHDELQSCDRCLANGDQVLFINLKNNHTPSFEHRGESRRLTPGGIRKMIKEYAELAGIPEDQAHPHALRHLVGSELAEDSATTLEIMTILGHTKEETTKIYTTLALRKLTSLMDKSNPLGKTNTPVSPLVKEFREKGLL